MPIENVKYVQILFCRGRPECKSHWLSLPVKSELLHRRKFSPLFWDTVNCIRLQAPVHIQCTCTIKDDILGVKLTVLCVFCRCVFQISTKHSGNQTTLGAQSILWYLLKIRRCLSISMSRYTSSSYCSDSTFYLWFLYAFSCAQSLWFSIQNRCHCH